MKLAILLISCCVFALGQIASPALDSKTQTPSSPCDQKPKSGDGLGTAIRGRQLGELDILSDTQGVDFGPYLQRIVQDVKENWYQRSPASGFTKRGELAIEFAIAKDGKVADMRLVASSRDDQLPQWLFAIYVGQAKRLALNPPTYEWSRWMNAKNGGYAVQRLYRREGRNPTEIATLVRVAKQRRLKEDVQRQLAGMPPRPRGGFTA